MKFPLPASLLLALASPAPASVPGDVVALNNYPSVVSAARYHYFDHSPGHPFLADGYHPGEAGPPALLSPDGRHTPGPTGNWISFEAGALTDGNAATFVTGWAGRTRWQAPNRNDGPYILFDLGHAYNLARVDIRLRDHSGQRWYAGADHPQRLWTAVTLSAEPGRGVAIENSSSYWKQQYTFAASRSDMAALYPVAIDPGQPTRYVLLMLSAGVVDGSNTGGIVTDVLFYAAHPLQIAPAGE